MSLSALVSGKEDISLKTKILVRRRSRLKVTERQ